MEGSPVLGQAVAHRDWLVAEFGRRAGYARNIEADPTLRIDLDAAPGTEPAPNP